MASPSNSKYGQQRKCVSTVTCARCSVLVWCSRPSHIQPFSGTGVTQGAPHPVTSVPYRDTAGDEKFRAITSAYYRGATAVMIVLDVTNEESYSDLSKWMEQVKQFGSDKVEVLLVANKCDLEGERCVTEQQCQKFAIQYDLDVMYVSAKTGENINEAFETLAKSVLSRIEQDVPPA